MSTVIERIEQNCSGLTIAKSPLLQKVLPLLTFVLITTGLVFVFAVVPNERIMGAVQRIFYFHVGAAMATYLSIAVMLLGSVLYLVRRANFWDMLAEAGAAVSLLFASQVLATGMIWGHSAWNVWWRWEPRLVSFLLLWLLLVAYWLLRKLSDEHPRQRNFAAIMGILSAINVPIVVFSVKLLRASEQLHPQVVANQGLRDSSFVLTLILCILAMSVLALWLIMVVLQAKMLEEELLSSERGLLSRRGNG